MSEIEDYGNLRAALLDMDKPYYEQVRAELIERIGYNSFRDLQNSVFKEIGTVEFEKKYPAKI